MPSRRTQRNLREPRPALVRQPHWSARWPGAVLVGGLALAVRAAHLLESMRLPLFDRPTVDAALYVDTARRIAHAWILPEVFFKPPLYPYALGTWMRVVGENWLWLRIPFVGLGAVTAVLVWALARRLFDGRVACVAGLLQALLASAVYFDAELLEIGLVTCVQIGALLLVARAGRSGSRLQAAIAGLALGVGCVARPVLLLFAPIALIWLGRRRALPAAVGLVAAIAPVTVHNAVHGHDFVPIASNLGLNLYIGNNPMADGRVSTTPELPAEPARARVRAQEIAEAARGRPLRPSEVSAYWQGRALEYAGSHPGRTLALLCRKLFYACSGWPISDNEDLGGLGRYLRLYAVLPVRMWLLVPLGWVGLLAARSRAPRELLLVRAYAVTQVAATLPFFVVERFRMPWTPVLAVCAGWTLIELWDRARARRPSLGLVLGTAAALGLCNLPLFGVRAAPLFDLDYKIGYAYQQKGMMPEAIAAYRNAVQRNPRAALARNALGYLMVERGEDLDQAVQLIEAALTLDPTHTANYAESLAFAQVRRGNAAAALAACSRGLAARPEPPTRAALLLRRAEAHVLAGDRDSARADAQAALEVAPAGGEVAARARQKLAELGMESELQTRHPGP